MIGGPDNTAHMWLKSKSGCGKAPLGLATLTDVQRRHIYIQWCDAVCCLACQRFLTHSIWLVLSVTSVPRSLTPSALGYLWSDCGHKLASTCMRQYACAHLCAAPGAAMCQYIRSHGGTSTLRRQEWQDGDGHTCCRRSPCCHASMQCLCECMGRRGAPAVGIDLGAMSGMPP
jgi:hypothetical protein